jgi:heme exporter protein D
VRGLDFSSWQALLTTLLSLAVFTLIGVGVRLIMMQTIQQRRERMNRQINERLKTLIAAYKTLGGSFTGQLTVDPTHLREVRLRGQGEPADAGIVGDAQAGSERARRIRDAVEAALADILLLGTEEHCRLAGQAASDLAAGRPIHTAELVISLRSFIRAALDLDPIPGGVAIPLQGPARVQAGTGRGRAAGGGEGGGGGGGRGGAQADGGGMGIGMGVGLGTRHGDDEHPA